MKKLLLLGGVRYLIPVIKKAQEMGIYTITCDYLPNNLAHKHSNEYHNISITNVDALIELGKSLKIDGIMSFGVDPGVLPAAKVAKALKLPMPGPIESIEILQNKAKFRAFLKKHNFNVPEACGYTSVQKALVDLDRFKFPIIVKPVDSAGSKGVTKVNTKIDVEEAIKYAISFSHTQSFIIEEFIEKKGFSSDTDSFSINGDLVFTSFNAQRFDPKAPNPFVPAAYSWPASFSITQTEILKSELQRLISLLNMQTSLYNIEVRVNQEGTPYIMEVAPRGGGNRLTEILQYITGEEIIENTIKAAINGETTAPIQPYECKGHWAERILYSHSSGCYKSLFLSDEIAPFIFEKDIWIKQGDKVEKFTAANKTIGTLVLKFDTAEQLEYYLNNIDEHIKVLLD